MKTKIIALIIASLTFANAAEKIKAPNGGRIVEAVTPHAEFLITPDKKIEIRFLDVTGRAAPTKLAFTKDGDKLVSDKVIPEGKELPVVLQIRAKEGEKAVTEKFNLNLAKCPTCSNPEYACTCDH